MRTARTIVVGYDAQQPSERALTWALRRAGEDGRVVVVHAARRQPDRLRVIPQPGRAERLARARAVAELPFLERTDVHRAARCDFEVRDDTPAEALLAVADEVGADEIVVGSRRLDRMRSLTGSVCSDLMHRCSRPLVVVP
jgi:nucleotide-binding universal stress UspA family protein